MSQNFEFYKCNICGTLVEVVQEGAGELVCCNEPMELLTPHQNEDVHFEHHLPVLNKTEDYQEIVISETPHPMEKEHFIEFIEVYSKGNKKIMRRYLNPNDEAKMRVPICFEIEKAVAMCNVHGLWEAKFI